MGGALPLCGAYTIVGYCLWLTLIFPNKLLPFFCKKRRMPCLWLCQHAKGCKYAYRGVLRRAGTRLAREVNSGVSGKNVSNCFMLFLLVVLTGARWPCRVARETRQHYTALQPSAARVISVDNYGVRR